MTDTLPERSSAAPPEPGPAPQIALVDLLDRLLGTGVVISGDIVVSMSGVDLVEIKLNALITSVRAEVETITQSGGRP